MNHIEKHIALHEQEMRKAIRKAREVAKARGLSVVPMLDAIRRGYERTDPRNCCVCFKPMHRSRWENGVHAECLDKVPSFGE
jgi:hypothetical protein